MVIGGFSKYFVKVWQWLWVTTEGGTNTCA